MPRACGGYENLADDMAAMARSAPGPRTRGQEGCPLAWALTGRFEGTGHASSGWTGSND